MKKIILLGASGSIGLQAIDVVLQHSTEFEIVAISVGNNVAKLHEILKMIEPGYVCVKDESKIVDLKTTYPDICFFCGSEGLIELVSLAEGEIVLNALMGFVGLVPTLEAIKLGKDVALANKETLVAGGMLVEEALTKSTSRLLPIDSEHSAILQCLQGNETKNVKRLIITASGGSFRDKSRAELSDVTVAETLNHPNWSMGAKITIDSASMMNKGLEVIEAHWLFKMPYDKIDTIMHRESIVHSMVEFEDTSIIAQLGTPDMRLPIQYALTYPNHKVLNSDSLDFEKVSCLHFEPLSTERFPLLKLAYDVGKKSGNLPAIMNAANEAAVDLFINEKIKFPEIEELVLKAVSALNYIAKPTLDDIIMSDAEARAYVYKQVKGA